MLVHVSLLLIGQQGSVPVHFVRNRPLLPICWIYKIFGVPKKFKKLPRPLLRLKTNYTCQQKPIPSREIVPVRYLIHTWLYFAFLKLGPIRSGAKIISPALAQRVIPVLYGTRSGHRTHSIVDPHCFQCESVSGSSFLGKFKPDPGFWWSDCKVVQLEKIIYFYNLFILFSKTECPSYRKPSVLKREHPSLETWILFTVFHFCFVTYPILPSWIRIWPTKINVDPFEFGIRIHNIGYSTQMWLNIWFHIRYRYRRIVKKSLASA